MEQQLIRHKGESSEFIVSFVTFQAVLMVLQITFNGKCLEKNPGTFGFAFICHINHSTYKILKLDFVSYTSILNSLNKVKLVEIKKEFVFLQKINLPFNSSNKT